MTPLDDHLRSVQGPEAVAGLSVKKGWQTLIPWLKVFWRSESPLPSY